MPHAGSSTVSPRRGSVTSTMKRNNGARRVEFAGIASGVSHLLQHRLVEMRERMDFIRGTEVDAVDLVDDVPKKEAAVHPVDRAAKYVGDHVSLICHRSYPGVAQVLE